MELTLVPPKDHKAFAEVKATISKDATEAKVSLESVADAKPGSYEGTVEAKLNFNGQELTMKRPFPLTIISPNPS